MNQFSTNSCLRISSTVVFLLTSFYWFSIVQIAAICLGKLKERWKLRNACVNITSALIETFLLFRFGKNADLVREFTISTKVFLGLVNFFESHNNVNAMANVVRECEGCALYILTRWLRSLRIWSTLTLQSSGISGIGYGCLLYFIFETRNTPLSLSKLPSLHSGIVIT